MNKFIRGTVAALLATAPVTAFAATQTGNLNVTTTIQVSCDAPSPSGTLNLPFDSETALNGQALASTPVTVSVTCYGNPTVNHVDFDNGDYRDATNVTEEDGVRYMLRSGSGADSADDYLGYQLFATDGTESNSTTISNDVTLGTGATANDNRLTLGETFAGTFSVTGKVYESTTRTGAFGDPATTAAAGAVPGGTYSDIVVMTVDYN